MGEPKIINIKQVMDELLMYNLDHEASHTYLLEKEKEYDIDIINMPESDRDHVEKEYNRFSFSHKTITGRVLIQLVEFYIKNHGKAEIKQ